MKVRELKNLLELRADDSQMTQALTSFSHWVRTLFEAKEYAVSGPKDRESLRKLELLGVVEFREEKGVVIASLNKSGKKLYQDFYGHGYYL